MAEIGSSQQIDPLNRLREGLPKGNIIDQVSASELIIEALQELETKNDKISALEEELSQKIVDSAKFKAELDLERAMMGEVFRQNPSGIVIMDAQSGKATRVNMIAKKINEELIFKRVDGHKGVLNVSSGPIFDCNGRVVAAVATFSDVTGKGNK